eukprot:5918946-Amphidinium_carterae.1
MSNDQVNHHIAFSVGIVSLSLLQYMFGSAASGTIAGLILKKHNGNLVCYDKLKEVSSKRHVSFKYVSSTPALQSNKVVAILGNSALAI